MAHLEHVYILVYMMIPKSVDTVLCTMYIYLISAFCPAVLALLISSSSQMIRRYLARQKGAISAHLMLHLHSGQLTTALSFPTPMCLLPGVEISPYSPYRITWLKEDMVVRHRRSRATRRKKGRMLGTYNI